MNIAVDQFDNGLAVLTHAALPAEGTPLVLTHGFARSWRDWEPLMVQLAQIGPVHALEARGHGASARVPLGYEVADHTSDLLLFLQAHVVTPAILVAHSASSFVALRAAVRRPDLVSAVVLEDPPLYVSERGMPEAMRQAFEGMVQLLRSEMSHEQIVELIDSPRDEAMAETDLDAYELFLETWVGVSQGVDRLLRRLAQPLLVLHGEPERGSMLPPEDRRRLVTQHPAARFAPVAGAGHYLHAAAPERFVEIISAFVEGLDDRHSALRSLGARAERQRDAPLHGRQRLHVTK